MKNSRSAKANHRSFHIFFEKKRCTNFLVLGGGSTVGNEHRAGNPLSVVGQQESDGTGDVARVTDAKQVPPPQGFVLFRRESLRVALGHFGFHPATRDTIHANTFARHPGRERCGHASDAGSACGVSRFAGNAEEPRDGGYENDAGLWHAYAALTKTHGQGESGFKIPPQLLGDLPRFLKPQRL